MNEAGSLVRQGYRVTFIGWDRKSEFTPVEQLYGVKVIRLQNTGYMNLLRFDVFRLRPWWRLAYGSALRLYGTYPFHAIYCHDLDTLPTGVWLKKEFGVPLIYDAHEIWGHMVSRDLPGVLASYFLRRERRLIGHVDMVITVSEPTVEYFEKFASAHVVLTMNARHVPTTRYVPPRNDSFTAIYVGTLNDSRFVRELVDSFRGLEGVKLVLAGMGKPAYVQALEEKCEKVANVEFIGRVSQEEVLPLTLKADCVICLTVPSDKDNSIAMANKQFDAMACGRSIVVSRDTYLAYFTEKHGVGTVVEHSIQGVKKGVRNLRDNPELCESLGRRALELALQEFNWERQEEVLVRAYEKLR
ncbi:MAG: glycosyltransferase [Thermoplasmata archaeon]